MSEQQQNVDLVKKGYAAFSAGDVETVMSLYDDNVEWVQPGDSEVSGTHRGKEELGQFLARMGEKMTELKPVRFLADGDTVVVFSDATIGDDATQDVEVFTLRGGKVVQVQTYGDTALMARVYGRKQLAGG